MSIGFIGLHYWQNHFKNVCRRCQAWPLVQQIWHCYHCQHRRRGWFGCRCPRSLKRFNVRLYIVLMLPLIPILAGGIMKLTQDERERYEQRLQWKKEGSSYEIEFAYGLLDSSERPLGRVPARTGMAAPWHKHVAVLLAESCILMNIVISIISPVDKDHVANKPFSHRFFVYFITSWSWGEFRALGWRDSCGQSAEGRTSCDGWWVARGMLCFQKPCRKSLRHVQRLKEISMNWRCHPLVYCSSIRDVMLANKWILSNLIRDCPPVIPVCSAHFPPGHQSPAEGIKPTTPSSKGGTGFPVSLNSGKSAKKPARFPLFSELFRSQGCGFRWSSCWFLLPTPFRQHLCNAHLLVCNSFEFIGGPT